VLFSLLLPLGCDGAAESSEPPAPIVEEGQTDHADETKDVADERAEPDEEAAPDEDVAPEAAPDAATCCCAWSDPAGAGLTRFGRGLPDQDGDGAADACEGPYWVQGCTDEWICDVAKDASASMSTLGVVNMRAGDASFGVPANPDRMWSNDDGSMLFYAAPAEEVLTAWKGPLTEAGFVEGEAGDTEHHGVATVFTKDGQTVLVDLEAKCMDSSGTCVWTNATP